MGMILIVHEENRIRIWARHPFDFCYYVAYYRAEIDGTVNRIERFDTVNAAIEWAREEIG